MPKIIISNVPGLEGEYDLDMSFTHRDFRTIKQVAGVRANEVSEALNAGDLDIIVAMAEIALVRAGKVHSLDQLWDSEAGAITLDVADMEDAPDDPPPSGDEPKSDAVRLSSGVDTNGDTESSPVTLIREDSGTQPQVSMSDQVTSTI
jgi:hypothetical protein